MKIPVATIILPAILMSACTSYKTISIDYKKPAKYYVGDNVRAVGVLNMIEDKQLTSEELNATGIPAIKTQCSFLGEETTMSMAQGIADSGYFRDVIISDKAWNQKKSPDNIQKDSILNSLNVDALIAVKDAELDWMTFFYDTDYYSMTDAITSIAYSYKVEIYRPEYEIPNTILIQDTIFSRDYLPIMHDEDGFSVEMNQDTIRKSLSEAIGYNFAASITPSWHQADRIIFTTSCEEMDQAKLYVEDGKWGKALKQWEKLQRSKNSRLKAQAAFNIALYHEIHDNMDEAAKWLDTAEKEIAKTKNAQTRNRTLSLITAYKSALAQRYADMQKLKRAEDMKN